ncbi:glycosyltransferase family 2 protein [Sphingobacterium sp. UT-1RO-CII-1]|uniref:glycosyltransferase family 2 protein n=1 Tax=Sphingobacterium sp. UT-1RO-CII-1 TaxID=2995225 RepID=UPI00227BAE8A|nr:glycosyltransferase family 2 protein [Sphingobacterium sp. UT-1RO-CII-1]MCY4778540.1 glycosyltransferase family 2 protein [Sphingobacterium sp. UT-1RO-CII-1]
MKDFSVSVIVPFYNAESYIEKCAHSLFSQTLEGIQFVFVNDKSTDGSVERLNNVIKQYPSRAMDVVIINHEKNKGAATSRNTGIEHVQGEYIGWVDADDWVEQDMFEMMYNQAVTKDLDIVWIDFYNSYGEKERLISQECDGNNLEYIKKMLNGRLSGVMWNKLTKRSIYIENDIRFQDGLDMGEDLRVNVQLFYYSRKIEYLKGVFYHHFKMKIDSITRISFFKPKINLDWLENTKAIIAFAQDCGIELSETEVGLMKLGPKVNLLVRGVDINTFKTWRIIFPEANRFIWKTSLPFHYKIIGCCADKEYWFLLNLWIKLKRLFKRNEIGS